MHLPTRDGSSCIASIRIVCPVAFRPRARLSPGQTACRCSYKVCKARTSTTPHHHTHLWIHLLHQILLIHHTSVQMVLQQAPLRTRNPPASFHYLWVKKMDGLSSTALPQSVWHPSKL